MCTKDEVGIEKEPIHKVTIMLAWLGLLWDHLLQVWYEKIIVVYIARLNTYRVNKKN